MTAKKYITTISGSAWIATDTPRFANIRDGLEKPASDRAYFIAMGVIVAGLAFIVASIIAAYALYPV